MKIQRKNDHELNRIFKIAKIRMYVLVNKKVFGQKCVILSFEEAYRTYFTKFS